MTAKQTLQPKLRFPEFEGDWIKGKISDLGDIITGNTPSTTNEDFYNGGFLFVSPYDINSNRWVSKTKTTLTKEGFKKGRFIQKGSSLFVCIGSTIGKIAQNSIDCVTNQQINAVVPKDNDRNFVFSLLEYNAPKIRMLAVEQAVPLINKTTFSQFELFTTSVKEQTKMANFLSSIDEKINLLKEKKSLLEAYKKGMMQKIFNQEIRFKDDNGNDFEDWEEKSIGHILSIGSGRDYKHLNPGDVPVYGTGGLMTHVDGFLHQGETVCIGRKGTIDKPMYFNGDIWTVDTLFYTHTFIDSIPKYVFYVFQSINWKQHNEASGVPSLSKSTIEQITVNLPPVTEQTKIANFLSALDEKIVLVATQIKDTQKYKKGLLQQMFV